MTARTPITIAAITTVNTLLAVAASDWHAVMGWLAATAALLLLAHEVAS